MKKKKTQVQPLFEHLNLIADILPANVYWLDVNNVLIGLNHRAASAVGAPSPAAVIGKKLHDIYPDAIAQKIIDNHTAVMRENNTRYQEEKIYDVKTGEERHFSTIKSPIHNQQSKLIGSIGISIDITKRKTLEKKLAIEKKKVESASRSKSEFIANMSHDIRTPITGMLALSQKSLDYIDQIKHLLQHPPVDTQQLLQQLITTLEHDQPLLISATHELLKLCNGILEVVQLESGKITAHTEIFRLDTLLQHTVDLLSPVACDKGLTLSFDFDNSIPSYVKGNRLYVNRILLNLISNALKFTHQGFVHITASRKETGTRTQASCQPGETLLLYLCVKDSGIGIPQDKQGLVFMHFSRLNASYQGIYKGVGLGLYTVKQYVDAMGGHIQLHSQVGQGSCFCITLPLMAASAKEFAEAQKKNATMLPLITPPSLPAMDLHKLAINTPTSDNATILIVEDNPIAAMGLQLTLKHLGYTAVDIANSTIQALKQIQNNAYQLILMDVGLPGMNGVDAAKAIRALQPPYAYIPIIAITGHAENQQHKRDCLHVGMQAVLSKPAQPDALRAVLMQYMQAATKA